MHQSKELSKRWEKTSKAITEQAKEMRRIMERQIAAPHLNSSNHDAFIALKTKVPYIYSLKNKKPDTDLRYRFYV